MRESVEMKNKPISKEEAITEVGLIRQNVHTMGANDYEIPALRHILEDLEKGEIEPEQAIKQAQEIMYSKQDYH